MHSTMARQRGIEAASAAEAAGRTSRGTPGPRAPLLTALRRRRSAREARQRHEPQAREGAQFLRFWTGHRMANSAERRPPALVGRVEPSSHPRIELLSGARIRAIEAQGERAIEELSHTKELLEMGPRANVDSIGVQRRTDISLGKTEAT